MKKRVESVLRRWFGFDRRRCFEYCGDNDRRRPTFAEMDNLLVEARSDFHEASQDFTRTVIKAGERILERVRK